MIIKKATRVEVIDETGRAYFKKDPNMQVTVEIQDEGRTVKVIIRKI